MPATIAEVRAAADRIASHVRHTPVLTCASLDRDSGARLFFKCENFQRAGAFKFRGALNAVLSLTDAQAANGVVTHSSGNHAAALALAARLRGIPARIVMPRNSPATKQQAVVRNGATLTLCEPTLAAREATAARLLAESHGMLVHPYDDDTVIAGQGTVALEFTTDVPELDALIAPVSGGGLLSGVAIATASLLPQARVYGAEPAAADDAFQSLREGRLIAPMTTHTIADGLRAALSERTFGYLRQHVRGVVTVTEDQIMHAMRVIWERLKLVVEPSGAVPLAAVLAQPELFRDRRVGVILTGGNVDLDRLPWP